MADKIIDVPGLGVVSFPDTVSDEQIAASIKQSLAAAKPHGTSATHGGGIKLKGPTPPTEAAGVPQDYGLDDAAGNMSAVLRHVATAATPAVGGAAMANPVSTALRLGVGGASQQIIQKVGEMLGFPGAGALAGDVGGAATAAIPDIPGIRSPIKLGSPRMAPLSDLLKRLTPDAARPVHPDLKEAYIYDVMRKLSGIGLQNPIEGTPPPATGFRGIGPQPSPPPDVDNSVQPITHQPTLGPLPSIRRTSLPELFGTEASTAQVPEFSSVPQTKLPSGRIPGLPTPAEAGELPTIDTKAPNFGQPKAPQDVLDLAQQIVDARETKGDASAKYLFGKKIHSSEVARLANESPTELKAHAKAAGYPRGFSAESLEVILRKLRALEHDAN